MIKMVFYLHTEMQQTSLSPPEYATKVANGFSVSLASATKLQLEFRISQTGDRKKIHWVIDLSYISFSVKR